MSFIKTLFISLYCHPCRRLRLLTIPQRAKLVWHTFINMEYHTTTAKMETLTYRERLNRFINSREKALKIHATRLRNNMQALARTWDNVKWARFIITFEREILILLPSEESRYRKQRESILQMILEAKLLAS